jgi:hypothetical protein
MRADTDPETDDSTYLSNCASDSALVTCRGEADHEALRAVGVVRDSPDGRERLSEASQTTMAQGAAKTPTMNLRPNNLRGFIRFAKHSEYPFLAIARGIATAACSGLIGEIQNNCWRQVKVNPTPGPTDERDE